MKYITSEWKENDLITPGKMNNIEQGIANAPTAESILEEIEPKIEEVKAHSTNYTDEQIAEVRSATIPNTVISDIVLTTDDGYEGLPSHPATTLYLIPEEEA